MAIVSPIYTATVNDVPLRFFSPPNMSPLMPWVSVTDAQDISKLHNAGRIQMLATLHGEFPHLVKAVATADGIVVICSIEVADSLVEASLATAEIPEAIYSCYVTEATKAIASLTSGKRAPRLARGDDRRPN